MTIISRKWLWICLKIQLHFFQDLGSGEFGAICVIEILIQLS